MKPKLKFYALLFLLLFARGCDFYSTSLWFFQPGGQAGEMNPLTRFFGVGWNGLVLANLIVVLAMAAAYYYYTFYYKPKPIEAASLSFREFVSVTYFNKKDKFYGIFYEIPANKKAAIAHLGYVTARVIIFGSFLATVHNLCQFYNVALYDSFRELVKRPLYIIYGLMLASLVYFQYKVLKKEYEAGMAGQY